MASSETTAARRSISLGGPWSRFIRGERWDTVQVPSSLRPSGNYTLERTAWLPKPGPGERAFLRFEGVAYYADIYVNGAHAGSVGAWTPGVIEVTRLLGEGENRLQAAITDLGEGPGGAGRDEAAIGVNPGWEAYGGIVRDVWYEVRPSAFIENTRMSYQLSADASRASGTVRVFLSAATGEKAAVGIELFHGSNRVAQGSVSMQLAAGTSTVDVPFELEHPLLWSPEAPHCYRLATSCEAAGRTDLVETTTGFRQFAIRGRQFEWNGQPLTLQGFCRHDMWLNQGFTLTREQMRTDMRAIKQTGANFVRLVHYPHHRYVVELAEELGLLVTEEPGWWQVDFSAMPRSRIEAGLRTLEGVIRRDWNSPAVFGWFLGNESRLTVEYLREGKALCERLDPLRRRVSFANDRAVATARAQFDEAGLDFYSEHLYGSDSSKFGKTADDFEAAKPLVIDEWGWQDMGKGQIVWEQNFDYLLDAMQTGKIAGHAFWSWNDVRQYSRIDWPTHDGILFSGVVTESREPRAELYEQLTLLFQNRNWFPEAAKLGHTAAASERPQIVPLRVPMVDRGGETTPVPLQALVDSTSAQSAWASVERRMETFWSGAGMGRNQWERTGKRLLFWRTPALEISGVPFVSPMRDGFVRPLAATPEAPELVIPVKRDCDRIYLLGNVTLPSGYPLEGRVGETVATLELRYEDGRSQRVPLRNGIEVARSNVVHGSTRIEPLAVAAPRALLFIKDASREHYQALLYACPANGRVAELRLRLESGPPLVLFAISVRATGMRSAK